MKKITFALVMISLGTTAMAQWNDSGTNLTTSDNVGIGTTTPNAKTHIIAENTNGSNKHSFIIQDNTNTGIDGGLFLSSFLPRFILNDRSTSSTWFDFRVDHNKLVIGQGNNTDAFSRINDNLFSIRNGSVGIGTSTPNAKTHIIAENTNGSNKHSFIIQDNTNTGLDGGLFLSSFLPRFILNDRSTSSTWFDFRVDHNKLVIGQGNNTDEFNRMIDNQLVLQNGKVGIGTSDFSGSHKLRVEGSIGAREIKVEASGWSDFVFENDYKLRTLEEVEQYINQKGHLPEIPCEAEVTENGINLGEMNAKLLQKIEELTLYLIEQNKENQEQRKLIKELQNEVSVLKNE